MDSGKDFRKWRRNMEISQRKVAEYCNCNTSTICRWERGEMVVGKELLGKLMNFMNKGLEDG